MAASDRTAKIAERAYAIWVEGGHQDGMADENWSRAEREIEAETIAGGSLEPDGKGSKKVKVARKRQPTSSAPAGSGAEIETAPAKKAKKSSKKAGKP